MGLDITAYRHIRAAPRAAVDSEGYPVKWEKYGRLFPNDAAFAGREAGLKLAPKAVFAWAEELRFRAGSYSGYGEWRDELARLAGYEPVDGLTHPYARGAWDAANGPFWELINFADCEGVIGPVVAAKLVDDFDRYAERAAEHKEGWFRDLYKTWRDAFAMAADGGDGCVVFH
jgi:hypothetical protein